jgi:pimeloyl-ACP methyl ester carboxylesterase
MSRFVLIHGAWHGAWCWERVVPLLHAAGHTVIAPDLPGHGTDATPWWRVTLGAYARRARDTARQTGGPAIAVGHSMGGIVISDAAAREPGLFTGLIYLCAFVPQPGESLMALGRLDRHGRAPSAMRRGLTRSTIDPERGPAVFYNTCPPDVAAAATRRLCAQPNLPLFQGASAPRAPLPPRAYVECSEDRAISIAHQRFMRERAGIAHVAALATDHSPFFSAPEALAATLGELAQRLEAQAT